MSSDAGVLVLREIEQGLRIAEQMAVCLDDPRSQAQVVHGLASMTRFRMLMIAAGYEDGNDASTFRSDPAGAAACPGLGACEKPINLSVQRLSGVNNSG